MFKLTWKKREKFSSNIRKFYCPRWTIRNSNKWKRSRPQNPLYQQQQPKPKKNKSQKKSLKSKR